MYLFSSSSQECVGHFHGVRTEQYWSENNQMEPQTRQMNPGHRHDKITEHHSDWNWKKTVRMGEVSLSISYQSNMSFGEVFGSRFGHSTVFICEEERLFPKALRGS
jgi:hypothetical protein